MRQGPQRPRALLIAVILFTAVSSVAVAGSQARPETRQPTVSKETTSDESATADLRRPHDDGNIIPPGFPTAASTGVPAGVTLIRRVGDVLLQDDNAVLEGVDLEGCVIVKADNVTIRNSRISCAGGTSTPFPIRIYSGHKELHIAHTEIDGLGSASTAIVGDNWLADAVNIHNAVDGPRLGSHTTLRDSYVHDLARRSGSHNDTVQTLGGDNVKVLGNTLLAYNQRTNDPMNGVVQTGRLLAPLTDVLVENNYMDGGSYSIRGGSSGAGSHLITNYIFRNNLLGRNCGFGPVDGVEAPVTWDASNRWADTKRSISADPARNDKECQKREEASKAD